MESRSISDSTATAVATKPANKLTPRNRNEPSGHTARTSQPTATGNAGYLAATIAAWAPVVESAATSRCGDTFAAATARNAPVDASTVCPDNAATASIVTRHVDDITIATANSSDASSSAECYGHATASLRYTAAVAYTAEAAGTICCVAPTISNSATAGDDAIYAAASAHLSIATADEGSTAAIVGSAATSTRIAAAAPVTPTSASEIPTTSTAAATTRFAPNPDHTWCRWKRTYESTAATLFGTQCSAATIDATSAQWTPVVMTTLPIW